MVNKDFQNHWHWHTTSQNRNCVTFIYGGRRASVFGEPLVRGTRWHLLVWRGTSGDLCAPHSAGLRERSATARELVQSTRVSVARPRTSSRRTLGPRRRATMATGAKHVWNSLTSTDVSSSPPRLNGRTWNHTLGGWTYPCYTYSTVAGWHSYSSPSVDTVAEFLNLNWRSSARSHRATTTDTALYAVFQTIRH